MLGLDQLTVTTKCHALKLMLRIFIKKIGIGSRLNEKCAPFELNIMLLRIMGKMLGDSH